MMENKLNLNKWLSNKMKQQEERRLNLAIEHCKEIIFANGECEKCLGEHLQLMNWLVELKELREYKKRINMVAPTNTI